MSSETPSCQISSHFNTFIRLNETFYCIFCYENCEQQGKWAEEILNPEIKEESTMTCQCNHAG